MDLHPVVVLLAVTAGGSLWGIVGAFLAVPVAAVVAVFVRYISEHVDAQVSALPAAGGAGQPDASGSGGPGKPSPEPAAEDTEEPASAGAEAPRGSLVEHRCQRGEQDRGWVPFGDPYPPGATYFAGSGIPACSKPFLRSKQLSQKPHASPSSVGS